MHFYFMPCGSPSEVIQTLRDISNAISLHAAQHSALVWIKTAARARRHPDQQSTDLEMAAYPGSD